MSTSAANKIVPDRLVGSLGANDARADVIGFTAPAGAPQTTNYDAAEVNLGLVFTANSGFSVDALGVYYQGSSVPTNGSEVVGLYDQSGNLLASTTISFTSGLPGYVFAGIAPVALTGGDQYTVDAYTNGNSWAYGTTPTPASQITYVGSTYVYAGSLTFPTGTFFDASTSYYGPNLEIEGAVATPEPSSLGLLASIIALAGCWRYRKNAGPGTPR